MRVSTPNRSPAKSRRMARCSRGSARTPPPGRPRWLSVSAFSTASQGGLLHVWLCNAIEAGRAAGAEVGREGIDTQPDGAALITAERRRQVEVEGYSPEHDAEHVDGEFVSAAFSYARHAMCTYAPNNPEAAPPTHEPPVAPYWPWSSTDFKPSDFTMAGAIRDLTKAGALIAAEIDRLRMADHV